jgi:hypothetical protein
MTKKTDEMDEDEGQIIKEYTDSIEYSVNAKGEAAYKVKVYGDAKTEKGRLEMLKQMSDLETQLKVKAGK